MHWFFGWFFFVVGHNAIAYLIDYKVKSLSRVLLFATPWTVAPRLLDPWDFPGKSTGVGCYFLLQGNLLDPGIEPGSPALQADALPSELPSKPK